MVLSYSLIKKAALDIKEGSDAYVRYCYTRLGSGMTASTAALAEAGYPSRRATWAVPIAAGGITDTVAGKTTVPCCVVCPEWAI
jgi:hypothetical protein